MTPISCFALWMPPPNQASFRLRSHRLHGVAYPLSGVVPSHRPRGVTKQFLGVVQVFCISGGLGAQVAELEADACFIPRAVEAPAQFADAQWLAFFVLDEG